MKPPPNDADIMLAYLPCEATLGMPDEGRKKMTLAKRLGATYTTGACDFPADFIAQSIGAEALAEVIGFSQLLFPFPADTTAWLRLVTDLHRYFDERAARQWLEAVRVRKFSCEESLIDDADRIRLENIASILATEFPLPLAQANNYTQ